MKTVYVFIMFVISLVILIRRIPDSWFFPRTSLNLLLSLLLQLRNDSYIVLGL